MFGFHFGFYPQNPFAPTAVWNNIAPVQLPRPPPPAAKAAPAAAIEGATSAVPVPPPPGHRTAHVWHAQNTANPIFNITKKVHINTYSHHLINIEPVALQEVEDSRPAGLAPLMTVECMTWQAPPATMCERWSGVSPEIQGFMKGIETARNTIAHVVDHTIAHLLAGHDAALLEICCHAGTHRSVAVAEIIGDRLSEMGVDAYVMHLHRLRKPGDAL